MDKNKKELIFLMFLVAFGVNYWVFSLYIKPGYEMLKKEQAAYENLEKKLERLTLAESRLQEIKRERETLEEKVSAMGEVFPDEMNTPLLAMEFYDSCKKYEVTGESLSFSTQSEKTENLSGLTALPIILKIRGKKQRVEEYLKNLDDISGRKLSVERITIYTEDDAAQGIAPDSIPLGLTMIRSENIRAEITFLQYVKSENNQ